ncbi:MAG: hypothetical protein NXI27_24740 [Alphaproteobacteria bacterium]|nr:hypothetical protein [Alphaproteobacteria bacterium]
MGGVAGKAQCKYPSANKASWVQIYRKAPVLLNFRAGLIPHEVVIARTAAAVSVLAPSLMNAPAFSLPASSAKIAFEESLKTFGTIRQRTETLVYTPVFNMRCPEKLPFLTRGLHLAGCTFL